MFSSQKNMANNISKVLINPPRGTPPKPQFKKYTVKRRLSERQLSETSINRTLKETARACPSAIICMFTIAASTVRNVRRLWNVRMAEKPKKEGQNGDIYREKAEICKH